MMDVLDKKIMFRPVYGNGYVQDLNSNVDNDIKNLNIQHILDELLDYVGDDNTPYLSDIYYQKLIKDVKAESKNRMDPIHFKVIASALLNNYSDYKYDKKSAVNLLKIFNNVLKYSLLPIMNDNNNNNFYDSLALVSHSLVEVGDNLDEIEDFSLKQNIDLLYYLLRLEYRMLHLFPKYLSKDQAYVNIMNHFIKLTDLTKGYERRINKIFAYNLHVLALLFKLKYDYFKCIDILGMKTIQNTFMYYSKKVLNQKYSVDFYAENTNNSIIDRLETYPELSEVSEQLKYLYNKCINVYFV